MKKISLTTMILLALVLGVIIGVVLNNTASPETAKLYAQEISISVSYTHLTLPTTPYV